MNKIFLTLSLTALLICGVVGEGWAQTACTNTYEKCSKGCIGWGGGNDCAFEGVINNHNKCMVSRKSVLCKCCQMCGNDWYNCEAKTPDAWIAVKCYTLCGTDQECVKGCIRSQPLPFT